MSILEVKGLKKTYTTRFGGNQVQALKNVSFSVEEGEYVAIMGESGSGKTTLLNILAALDKPTGGTVLLDGRNLADIRESAMAEFRRDNLGFVLLCWTHFLWRIIFICRWSLRARITERCISVWSLLQNNWASHSF